MNISHLWLQDYIALQESPEEVAALLTATGLEVENLEAVEAIKGGLQGLVIGEVLQCIKHPNADKLSLCQVDVGSDTPSSIVCGASNVAQGQKVVVALPGTTLYPTHGEPFKIKAGKIRGEVSEGMICAEDEIGLGSNHEGILVLDTELPNGTPAATFFKLKQDTVYEIGLTPNRTDAISHLGVARDLKAVLQRPICLPELPKPQLEADNKAVEVRVKSEACIRYSGISLSQVKVADSPDWLQNRLKAIGLEPINNVVDITNFVLHSFGQPLHAFDQDQIKSQIVEVKTLPHDTPFTTLDGKERKLAANDLIICDADTPMCIAGVFGGLSSGVSEATSTVFLESACFDPGSVRSTSKYHGLKTDASFRFERGTDPNGTLPALLLAVKLIQEIAGGKVCSDLIDIYPQPVDLLEVTLQRKNLDRLIGISIGTEQVSRILKDLDFEILEEHATSWHVRVPSYRRDVIREADVIEEILRIYGLDNIAMDAQNSTDYLAEFPQVDKDSLNRRISLLLNGKGYSEIMTNSLCKPIYSEKIEGFDAKENVEILNKLSEDLGVLRQHLAFTGLEVIAYNLGHRQDNLKLFEFGKTYAKKDGAYREEEILALYLCGDVEEEHWSEKTRKVAYHDLYQTLSLVLEALNVKPTDKSIFKSGIYVYGMELSVAQGVIARLGQVHPGPAKLAGVKAPVFMAEIAWQKIMSLYQENRAITEVSKFPEVRRDLSIVLDKGVSFKEIQKHIAPKYFPLVKRTQVFDVYEGDKLEAGKKAYALSFILQDENKTLTDKDIDRTMGRLMHIFEKELGAIIRK